MRVSRAACHSRRGCESAGCLWLRISSGSRVSEGIAPPVKMSHPCTAASPVSIVESVLTVGGHYLHHMLMGTKDWELQRKPNAKVVERWIGLAASGTGHVFGVAFVVAMDRVLPSQMEALAMDQEHHRLSERCLRSYASKPDGSTYAALYVFRLAHVTVLDDPISYVRRRGSMIWVKPAAALQVALSHPAGKPAGSQDEASLRRSLISKGGSMVGTPWRRL